MNFNQLLVLVLCLIVSIISSVIVSIYAGAICLVITVTLAICFYIYNSAGKAIDKPILLISIDENGKTLLLHNIGNRGAENIRTSLVPANVEFTIRSIPQDSLAKHETGSLLGKNRAIIRYEDEDGKEYFHKQDLVFRDECEYDPTKPMIQLF